MYEDSPGSSRETILQIITEQVEAGNPVIYRGDRLEIEEDTTGVNTNLHTNDGKIGHAMVAYNVDDDGDVELHTGHTTNPYSKISTTKYEFNIGVLWIEIKEDIFSHSCSDNYIWYPDETPVCSCIAYKDMHPEHTHEFTQVTQTATTHTYQCKWGCEEGEVEAHTFSPIVSESDTIHSATCECGYIITNPHDLTYQILDNTHVASCECGYQNEAAHTLGYQQLSATTHLRICACDYQYNEAHILGYQQLSDNTHIRVCDCGYQYEESHSFECQPVSDGVHTYVCECGYEYEEAHSFSLKRASEDYHRYVCDCGYSYNEEHTLTQQDYHTDACVCGYTYTTPHNYIYLESADEDTHIAICECGYNKEVPHNYTYKSISNSYHSRICPCGYIAPEEAHVYEQIDIRYSACKFCGYTRDNLGPGQNIQMGTEEEEKTE